MFRVAEELTPSNEPDKKKDVRSNKNLPFQANLACFEPRFFHLRAILARFS
jgi:hypothetical protein